MMDWWRELPNTGKALAIILGLLAGALGAGAGWAIKGQVYVGLPGRMDRLERSDSIQAAWVLQHQAEWRDTNRKVAEVREILVQMDTFAIRLRDMHETVIDLSCHVRGLTIAQCLAERARR